METVGNSCPDPEALAAWLDRGLSAAESAEIEAHVAGCDDCRIVVAHVLETQTAVQEPVVVPATAPATEPLVGLARFSTMKLGWGLASVLAAAAMLSLALDMPPSRWLWGGRSIDSKLADLAAAVGTERTIEPRLTGGFAYGPLRAAVRSGGSSAVPDNWTLYAAAGRIREDTDRDPTAANLHALGLAHLVLGQHDDAVRALEDAVAEEPKNGRYQSDLAGAYLARARQNDRPDDVPRALGAAERALKADDGLVEARFNRALALEALFLADQARQAWEDYLARDSSSEWASEARTHLEKLQRATPPPDLAGNDSPPPIRDTSVEAGLDWLLRQGLPRWADAVLSKNYQRAAAEHLTLTNYAKQISDASGDPFASALVLLPDAVDISFMSIAAKLGRLGKGLALLDLDDVPGAERELRTACVDVPPVIQSLCDVQLGTFDVMHRQDAQAERQGARALTAALNRGHAYIEGHAKRLQAYRSLFKGDYPSTAREYESAINVFERAKYNRQVGTLASHLADVNDLMGHPVAAWRWRSRALEVVARSGSPSQQYLAHLSAATFIARRGHYEAARAFIPTVDQATSARTSLLRIGALLEQSKAALVVGDIASARTFVDSAFDAAKASNDFRSERLRPTILLSQGSVYHAEGNLAAAERALTEALGLLGPERPQFRAAALLERARIRSQLSSDLGAAERDVDAAIALLATRSTENEPIQLDDAAAASYAIAALVQAHTPFQTATGLLIAEQLREVLDGVPEAARLGTSQEMDEALQRNAKTLIVYFLFGEDALLTWTIQSGHVRFLKQAIRPGQIERLTRRLEMEVFRRSPSESWQRSLEELYDLLLGNVERAHAATSIVFVPEGPLSRVPFGALRDRTAGQFIFERSAVRVASNLAFAVRSDLVDTHRAHLAVLSIGEPTLSDALASGLKPLKSARDEAYKVAALYPKSTVLVGEDATKSRVLAQLPDFDVVHFAGHAIPRSSRGEARLLLAGALSDAESALSYRDLAGRVSGSRIVLAACQTAADHREPAAGVGDIAATFLRSGADAVIGTLWQVDDAASEPFFIDVHRALLSGQTASVAVATAQRSCYASPVCRAAAATWIGTAAYGLE